MSGFNDEGDNYEPDECSEVDEDTDHGEQSGNDSSNNESPTPALADGWKSYGNDPDFVKHTFTLKYGFKPPHPIPNKLLLVFMLFYT
jgi:hypothetical protein